jgi:hypothetical protein
MKREKKARCIYLAGVLGLGFMLGKLMGVPVYWLLGWYIAISIFVALVALYFIGFPGRNAKPSASDTRPPFLNKTSD